MDRRGIDVIVAGGGIIGMTAAVLLAKLGLKVVVLESKGVPANHRAEDIRTLAITPVSRRILSYAGVWAHIDSACIAPFTAIRVSAADSSRQILFDGRPFVSALGYIIPLSAILNAFAAMFVVHDAAISIVEGQSVKHFTVGDDTVEVVLDNDECLRARLLLGADGCASAVREEAGIGWHEHDYRQHALACVVQTEVAHGGIARQRFLCDGPLAFLPLADPHACGVVWSTSVSRAYDLSQLEEAIFNTVLAQDFDHILGALRLTSARVSFPLRRGMASSYCASRVALVGDAAHRVHPLAGQGANLGLLDAASLSEVLAQAIAAQRDIGGLRILQHYGRWRRSENLLMMYALDGIKSLFASECSAMRWARHIGMVGVESAPQIKKWIMQRAMGFTGDLPEIARRVIV